MILKRLKGGEHLQPRSQCWERGREQSQPEADRPDAPASGRLDASASGQVQRWHAGMRRVGQDKSEVLPWTEMRTTAQCMCCLWHTQG